MFMYLKGSNFREKKFWRIREISRILGPTREMSQGQSFVKKNLKFPDSRKYVIRS